MSDYFDWYKSALELYAQAKLETEQLQEQLKKANQREKQFRAYMHDA
jgi:hypothetical protein